jgi:peptidylprolyl isomerase
MPSSREVRARQNRQKDRVAAAQAERQRHRRRRRQIGGAVGVILLVVVVAVGLAAGTNNTSSPRVAVAPTTVAPKPTTATTIAGIASVKGKPCVGLKDTMPKGAPALLLGPGPAPTKLTTQDLKVGTGAVVPKNAKVTVDYVGVACSTGKIFDSSYKVNQPFTADLNGGVIAGWMQGIPGMRVGGVRLLSIPSALAYGPDGSSPAIAPDEALFFVVKAEKVA